MVLPRDRTLTLRLALPFSIRTSKISGERGWLSPAACRVSSTGAPHESRAPEDTAVAGCRHSHSSRTTLVLDAVLGSATVCAVARGHCGGLLQLHGREGGR